ncbi:very-long-chain 3-oxoacyl-CoA reductase-like [Haliotis rubra]|uniref:very-long-chain 3-oxoacyl-CoA reductase-like n=1 Tax=Haliotis rubra TaxID=36100 RepID=UPI001EE578A2|nr:very-long-chain 3-oxoacyl-CoA reductase-like [Haliotis rubra]
MASVVQSYLGVYSDCFSVLGVLATAYVALKIFRWEYNFLKEHFLGPALGLSANVKKAGPWAVVTGCTDGIGKAYAEQLAKKGLNIVLMSRTQSKLDDLARDLESRFHIQTRVIAVDFTQTEIYSRIERELQGLEIGTRSGAVNNVGMAYELPEYFFNIPNREKMVKDMLNCNMLSMVMMTSIVTPGMIERGRGNVINIASSAAERPLPLLALYSASKVFMDYLTKALQIEYGSKGITFQSVRPNFVATKLSGIRRSNPFCPYPDQYVRAALATLGITNSTNGYFMHTIQSTITVLLPDFVVFNFLKSARKGALKRIERKKAKEN